MNAVTLSKYILSKCTEDASPVSNLQLQKILYYIQEYALQHLSRPLFEEKIQAWMFGPVVKEVYDEYKSYGSNEIIFFDDDNNYSDYSDLLFGEEVDTKKEVDKIIEDVREKNIWDVIGKLHKKGGPWDQIYQEGKGLKQEIPTDLIARSH